MAVCDKHFYRYIITLRFTLTFKLRTRQRDVQGALKSVKLTELTKQMVTKIMSMMQSDCMDEQGGNSSLQRHGDNVGIEILHSWQSSAI